MLFAARSKPNRTLRPTLVALEGRALLSVASPRHLQVPGIVHAAATRPVNVVITPLSSTPLPRAGNYRFFNFDGPTPGTNANTGTNINGISNSGLTVGYTISNNATNTNFVARPRYSLIASVSNVSGATSAAAFGINNSSTVVGSTGTGSAFISTRQTVRTFLPTGATTATAFGINDRGVIVGQEVTGSTSPGFIRVRDNSYITVNAPSGPNTVNVQGINNRGQVVGFAVGANGQTYGLTADQRNARNGVLTAQAVADPTIPVVAGEPGATFAFSQILAVNDRGVAVGYYGDSTGSQHGFLYNTNTGRYTFLDDPSVAFHNGVEVTQITGITNSGQLSGFYSDAAGVFHGFVTR